MATTWNEAVKQFTRVTDKHGKKIDIGIFETVVALNLLGITTRQSCEGHLQWGCPYPWIDLEPDEQQKYHLYSYLQKFYSTRTIFFNSVLVFRGYRMRSQEAAFSDLFTETERAQKLPIYQEEMATFTQFLKSLLAERV